MLDDPIAYFITWTCYGTFLPGDDRGWTKWHKGDQLPQPRLADWCHEQMLETAVSLSSVQRELVEALIREHCELRQWILHAVNCRSNHCHVVVTAGDCEGQQIRSQLKSWTTRGLKRSQVACSDGPMRKQWWTRKGSVRWLFDEHSLEAAIAYTNDAQDAGGSKANRT